MHSISWDLKYYVKNCRVKNFIKKSIKNIVVLQHQQHPNPDSWKVLRWQKFHQNLRFIQYSNKMIKWSPKAKMPQSSRQQTNLFIHFFGPEFWTTLNIFMDWMHKGPSHTCCIYRCVQQRRKENPSLCRPAKNCFIGQFKTGATTNNNSIIIVLQQTNLYLLSYHPYNPYIKCKSVSMHHSRVIYARKMWKWLPI